MSSGTRSWLWLWFSLEKSNLLFEGTYGEVASPAAREVSSCLLLHCSSWYRRRPPRPAARKVASPAAREVSSCLLLPCSSWYRRRPPHPAAREVVSPAAPEVSSCLLLPCSSWYRRWYRTCVAHQAHFLHLGIAPLSTFWLFMVKKCPWRAWQFEGAHTGNRGAHDSSKVLTPASGEGDCSISVTWKGTAPGKCGPWTKN